MLNDSSDEDDGYEAITEFEPDDRGIILPPSFTVEKKTVGIEDDNDSPQSASPRSASQKEESRHRSLSVASLTAASYGLSREEVFRLYILCMRCVMFPFNSVPTQNASERLQKKLTPMELEHVKSRLCAFIRGEFPGLGNCDPKLVALVEWYFNHFTRNYYVSVIVSAGGLTIGDLRDVFLTCVTSEVDRMKLREASTKDQIKKQWMKIFDAVLIEQVRPPRSSSGPSGNRSEELLSQLQQMLKVKRSAHSELCRQLQFPASVFKKQQLLKDAMNQIDRRRKLLAENEFGPFDLPEDLHTEEMMLLLEESIRKQVQDLEFNLRNFRGDLGTVSTGIDYEKYVTQLNFHVGKTKNWLEERNIQFGSDGEEQNVALGSVLPEFKIGVFVNSIDNLELDTENEEIFVSIKLIRKDLQDHSRRIKLQATDNPRSFDSLGEEALFTSSGPLPQIKLSVKSKRKSEAVSGIQQLRLKQTIASIKFLLYPDRVVPMREIGKRTLRKTKNPVMSESFMHNTRAEVDVMPKIKDLEKFSMNVYISMTMSDKIKCSGEMYICSPKLTNSEWRYRYALLIEASRGNFVLTCFKQGHMLPVDVIPLDGFKADYFAWEIYEGPDKPKHIYPKMKCLPIYLQSRDLFFFEVTRGNMNLRMAVETQEAREQWLLFLASATRQTIKPEPPMLEHQEEQVGDIPRDEMTEITKRSSFLDSENDFRFLYKKLVRIVLDYRLADSNRSLGWFSSNEKLLFDEYCARYAIRATERYLPMLQMLTEKATEGFVIDPSLLHFAFVVTSASFKGERLPGMQTKVDDGLGIYTDEEVHCFENEKQYLVEYLKSQIQSFTTKFPYGKPSGAFPSTIALLERILTDEQHNALEFTNAFHSDSLSAETDRIVRSCLKDSAVRDYSAIHKFLPKQKTLASLSNLLCRSPSEHSEVDIKHYNPKKSSPGLARIIKHCDVCIRFLRTIEKFFTESFSTFPGLLVDYMETFWCLMLTDVNDTLSTQPLDAWENFNLFQVLNNFFVTSDMMHNGKFHKQLCDMFTPMVVRYMDLTEHSVVHSFNQSIAKETWVPVGNGCYSSEDAFWKVRALDKLITDLKWPEEEFNEHLKLRMLLLASEISCQVAQKCYKSFQSKFSDVPKSRSAVIPAPCCVMINVISSANDIVTSMGLHEFLALQGHKIKKTERSRLGMPSVIEEKIDGIFVLLNRVFSGALNELLTEMARYDNKTTFVYSVYSFTMNVKSKVKSKFAKEEVVEEEKSLIDTAPPWLLSWLTTGNEKGYADGLDISHSYLTFVRNNITVLTENIDSQSLLSELFIEWYKQILSSLCAWLDQRNNVQLDVMQLNTLNSVIKKVYRAFLIEQIPMEELETDNLKILRARLQSEESGAQYVGNANMITEVIEPSDDEDLTPEELQAELNVISPNNQFDAAALLGKKAKNQ